MSLQGKLGSHPKPPPCSHTQAMNTSIQANHSSHIIYVNLLPDYIKQNNKTIYITCGMNGFMTFLARLPGWDERNPCYLHLGSSVRIWLALSFLFFGISLPNDSVTGTQATVFKCLCCRGIQVKLVLFILTSFLRNLASERPRLLFVGRVNEQSSRG